MDTEARELLKIAKEMAIGSGRIAGNGMSNSTRGLSGAIARAHDNARTLEGLIHYRTNGRGSSPQLDREQRRLVSDYSDKLQEVTDQLEDISRSVLKMTKIAEDMDEFMNYS